MKTDYKKRSVNYNYVEKIYYCYYVLQKYTRTKSNSKLRKQHTKQNIKKKSLIDK